MVNATYRYTISAVYVNGDDIVELPDGSVTSLTTNYDYDINSMPIIYMGFRINSNLYDIMVANRDDAKIILTIKKYDIKGASYLARNYIQKEFSYIISTDPDYHQPLNKLYDDKEKSADSYKFGTMALMDLESIDNNKVLYNDIIKNSNMISVVHKYTHHMNMVIEPFRNNNKIDTLIIPPITSITNLLDFLNKYSCFYNKGYRYFRDFNKTYLLSNEGNPVDDKTDIYSTIMINILDSTDPLTKSVGINIDKGIKAYTMNVDALDTHMDIDIVKNKKYNKIIGISSAGDIKDVLLNEYNENKKEKTLIQRIFNDNMTYVDNMKAEVDSSRVILQITRTELDSSVITPNKEYIIKNYREFQEYNGRFILSSKREVFIPEDTKFISVTIMVFKKVLD